MSGRKLERAMRRQITGAMTKAIANSRQYLVCYVLEDGAMASAIMMAGALTADEVDSIEYGLKQRHQKEVVIFNIIELEKPGGAPVVSLPTDARRAIQHMVMDGDTGTVPDTLTRNIVAEWLGTIGHPVPTAKE